MALTRLQNIISSVEGRIIYVNPDDFDSTDAIDNKGNSPLRPFKTIARAVYEVARYSYVSTGTADDKFDQFTILLYPGDHIVDNRPSTYAYKVDGPNVVGNIDEPFEQTPVIGNLGWSDSTKQYADLYKITNSIRGGLIIPRGISIIGLDLRKTKIRPKFIPGVGTDNSSAFSPLTVSFTADPAEPSKLQITNVSGGEAESAGGFISPINDLYVGAVFKQGVKEPVSGNILIDPGTTITAIDPELTGNAGNPLKVSISKPHKYTVNTADDGGVTYPYVDDTSRTALFKITGGCYFWQFSIFDGDPSGVFTSNSVKPQDTFTNVSPSGLSHSRLTVFEYATLNDLAVFYRKVADVDPIINEKFIETRIQENRIVGPLADKVSIEKVERNIDTVTITLSEELNLTAGNFVNVQGIISGTASIDSIYTGEKTVASVPDRSKFTFLLSGSETTNITSNEGNLPTSSYTSVDGFVEVEIDTVESASPYIFNISMRSIYGMCGMHADGAKATGFKSMVVAQYTGISLQKIDGAFFKYDEDNGLYSAGAAGQSLHTDIDAIYRPSERSYHIKASNRAVIQAVSVFAVGFADHFIGENGGDLSITNSNSNFGSNALRSIGFADQAFEKDSLGRITHIVPPRNVESTDANYYWETFDTVLTATSPTRLYLSGRSQEIDIRNGGTGFTTGLKDVFKNGQNTTTQVQITSVDNGVITGLSFQSNVAYGSLQPGDILTLESLPGEVDCTFVFGASLTSTLGDFRIGARRLNADGTSQDEIITVPLFANNTTDVQTEQTAVVNTANNIFDYDYGTTNWYINVNSANNNIYQTIAVNATNRYGSGKIETSPSSFIKRIVDERIDNDKIYRLRYETSAGPDGGLPSFPQTGYVIQPKKGKDILGLGDRFTDGANLLLLNKEIISNEVILRYKSQNGGVLPGNEAACKDDLISIIETIAHDIRFGGNATSYDGADLYTSTITDFEDERSATVEIINSVDFVGESDDRFDNSLPNNFRGLKWIVDNIINNGVESSPVFAREYGGIFGDNPIYISGEEQLINVTNGCTDVVDAAYSLLDIYIQAIGSDGAAGNLGGVTKTTFDNTAPNKQVDGIDRNIYERITGHEYNDTYYIYEVEEVQPYDPIEDLGVYYLTVIKGSIGIDSAVLPGNTYRLSQEIDSLYPEIDVDNVVSDPIVAKSVADVITIGRVTTTEGISDSEVEDNSHSITKEAVSTFLDEYLNNELEWIWDNKEAPGSIVTNDTYPNSGGTSGVVTFELESGNGTSESRRILIKPSKQSVSLDVELRRPSTIRSGNHTFEYVGFGPGNYSTAFPIRQTKILTDEQIKYSQSLKEAGGIAFYSGLNSNGDLYIGNTIINAVTGKTTENQITELETLTITNNLNVIGGSGNTIATNFQSPVNFSNNILGDGGEYIFSNLQLRNASGFNTVMTAVEGNSFPTGDSGDIAFNLTPVNGGHAASIYTTEWRPFGLVGVEKVHAYRATGSKYVLNVGSDLQSDINSQSVVNVNYDLDITANQRIGTHLDIGHAADAAIDSNTASKQTRLQIKDDIGGLGLTELSSIEVIKSQSNAAHNFIRFIDDQTPNPTEFFKVDTLGNVTIPTTSDYGLADRAWSCTIFIAGADDPGQNETTVNQLGANFFDSQSDLEYFTGTSQISPDLTVAEGNALGVINGFVYQLSVQLSSMTFFGTPGELTAYTNPNSILIFVNGILQDTYRDAVYDSATDRLYFTQNLQNGDRITIRGLAT